MMWILLVILTPRELASVGKFVPENEQELVHEYRQSEAQTRSHFLQTNFTIPSRRGA